MEGASIYWKRQGKKKEVGSAWKAVCIFGCSISNVWDPHTIYYFSQISSSPTFFCQVLSWELQDSWQCPQKAVRPGHRRDAAGDSSSQPASQTPRPGPSADDFRLSNWFSLSNKWSKSHSGSPWLLERGPRRTAPRSSGKPPGFPGHVSASVDRNPVVCLVTGSLFIFWRKWSSFVEFSSKESFRMAFVRPPAGTENVLTGILFLRNKR